MLLGGREGDSLREQLLVLLQDPEVVNLLHNASDYADTPEGLHHSLGLRHDQSSYGDHTHNGSDSLGVNELIAANGSTVTWDGTTFSVNGYVSIVSPGNILLNRNDGVSPAISSAAVGATGGLRIFGIPSSSEISVLLTSAGIIALGNGQTSIGGAVNIRNPSSAATSLHTLTLQPVAGQTGNLLRVVDSTNSSVIASITNTGGLTGTTVSITNGPNTGASLFGIVPTGQGANTAWQLLRGPGGSPDIYMVMPTGRNIIQNTDALSTNTIGTYGIILTPSGAGGLGIASDVNGGYIQSFTGKNLRLNQAGNPVQWGTGSPAGLLNVDGSISPTGMATTPTAIYSGTGAPNTALGVIGNYYFRFDTPTVALQRVYVKTAAAVWTGVV